LGKLGPHLRKLRRGLLKTSADLPKSRRNMLETSRDLIKIFRYFDLTFLGLRRLDAAFSGAARRAG